jgi:hypothetical protein
MKKRTIKKLELNKTTIVEFESLKNIKAGNPINDANDGCRNGNKKSQAATE